MQKVIPAQNVGVKKQKWTISGQPARVLPAISIFRTGSLQQLAAPIAGSLNFTKPTGLQGQAIFLILSQGKYLNSD
jgi:hypothetical protein